MLPCIFNLQTSLYLPANHSHHPHLIAHSDASCAIAKRSNLVLRAFPRDGQRKSREKENTLSFGSAWRNGRLCGCLRQLAFENCIQFPGFKDSLQILASHCVLILGHISNNSDFDRSCLFISRLRIISNELRHPKLVCITPCIHA